MAPIIVYSVVYTILNGMVCGYNAVSLSPVKEELGYSSVQAQTCRLHVEGEEVQIYNF